MSKTPIRKTETKTTTSVRHVVHEFGPNRENPPSLGHLREFVRACDGIPDDTKVNIQKGSLLESGRYLVTISLSIEKVLNNFIDSERLSMEEK